MADFSAYINSETPVLVNFYTDWCNPCKRMEHILEDLKSQVGDQVKILKVNVDKNPQLTLLYRVKNLPTLILFKGGKILWRWSGIVLPDELLRVLKPVKHVKIADYETYQR